MIFETKEVKQKLTQINSTLQMLNSTFLMYLCVIFVLLNLVESAVETTSICHMYNDTNTLSLTCVNGGKIKTIYQAYYGNPSGDCELGFSAGSCTSPNSVSTLSNNCMNLNTCSFVVNSANFGGDPCPQVVNKRFAMIVECESCSGYWSGTNCDVCNIQCGGGATMQNGYCDIDHCTCSNGQYWTGTACLSFTWEYLKGGGAVIEPTGLSGAAGVSDSTYHPGGKQNAISWIDKDNHLWVFGGHTKTTGGFGLTNDLWEFDGTNWKWWSGSYTTMFQQGCYDGICAAPNYPGARELSIAWCDTTENVLYLFGGNGIDKDYNGNTSGDLADLWKFDITTHLWSFIGGSNTKGTAVKYTTPNQTPGARHSAASWSNNAKQVWLFGGASVAEGWKNDLWMLDISGTPTWTFIGGSQSVGLNNIAGPYGVKDSSYWPGSRTESQIVAISPTNVYLYGGINSGTMSNDLWHWNGSQWSLESGATLQTFTIGVHSAKGTADPSNNPPSKRDGCMWYDSRGYLWLFGGTGADSTSTANLAYISNDLWLFDISKKQWVYMYGKDNFSPIRTVASITASPPHSIGSRSDYIVGSSVTNSFAYLALGYGTGRDGATTVEGNINEVWKFQSTIPNTTPQSLPPISAPITPPYAEPVAPPVFIPVEPPPTEPVAPTPVVAPTPQAPFVAPTPKTVAPTGPVAPFTPPVQPTPVPIEPTPVEPTPTGEPTPTPPTTPTQPSSPITPYSIPVTVAPKSSPVPVPEATPEDTSGILVGGVPLLYIVVPIGAGIGLLLLVFILVMYIRHRQRQAKIKKWNKQRLARNASQGGIGITQTVVMRKDGGDGGGGHLQNGEKQVNAETIEAGGKGNIELANPLYDNNPIDFPSILNDDVEMEEQNHHSDRSDD